MALVCDGPRRSRVAATDLAALSSLLVDQLREHANALPDAVQVVRTFCGECGTPLTFQEHARRDRLDVAVASLDQPQRLSSTEHVWTSSQLPWLRLEDDLPRHAHGSGR